MSDSSFVDVLIAGSGPAGVAAGIVLAKAGKSVLLVDRGSAGRFHIGETLPPGAMPFLQELELSVSAEQHLPCCGIRSSWGSPEVHTQDYLFQFFGTGYHLDRTLFDHELKMAVQQHGATLWEPAAVLDTRSINPSSWETRIQFNQKTSTVKSRWIIDASGRSRKMSRLLGLSQEVLDEMTAFYVLFADPANEDLEDFTLLESAAEGWWYTARLSGARRVVAFHTELDKGHTSQIKQQQAFLALLRSTQLISQPIVAAGFRSISEPKSTWANTSIRSPFYTPGLLAAGDALMSLDPLSGQGITNALYTGMLAAQTICAADDAGDAAFSRYEEAISKVFMQYQSRLKAYYGMERRWSGASFWGKKTQAPQL